LTCAAAGLVGRLGFPGFALQMHGTVSQSMHASTLLDLATRFLDEVVFPDVIALVVIFEPIYDALSADQDGKEDTDEHDEDAPAYDGIHQSTGQM